MATMKCFIALILVDAIIIRMIAIDLDEPADGRDSYQMGK